MQSRSKPAPIVDRDGISGMRGKVAGDVSLVEIDATFARTLGLSDGQKVSVSIHVDPPVAHTVHIQPLTPEDWEIIELHATFLEINLMAQIRALPNPNYTPASGAKYPPHPLTVHMSPTSTADIIITSLVPEPPSSSPFAKIAPNAEVIVAPKTRTREARNAGESRSVTSRRSGRSGASTIRRKSAREEVLPAMFFRGLDRSVCGKWFEINKGSEDQGLRVWVDRDILLSKVLKGVTWVSVAVIKPASLRPPVDPQKQQQEIENLGDAGKMSTKVVARLMAWDDPPDSQHIALSSALCASLACEGIVGGVVKLEPAPQQSPKTSPPPPKDPSQPIPKGSTQVVKIYPFGPANTPQGLKFGGESKAEREEASKRILKMYSKTDSQDGLLDGPITDGSILGSPSMADRSSGFEGGILCFDHPSSESLKQPCHWFLGSERKFAIDVQPPIPRPPSLKHDTVGDPLPPPSLLVGIDTLLSQLQSHLTHLSSVLLTGALGSGKTSITHHLAHTLRSQNIFHVTYFSCRSLSSEEMRISTIKEILTRLFMSASWGARLGGKSLVILDDLDKLCPVETELEVASNGRSRQISEGVCSVVRQYCGRESNVALLATAQAKESLHNVIVGGHVVKEIVGLKAPDKEARRRVVEMVVKQNIVDDGPQSQFSPQLSSSESRPTTANTSRPTTASSTSDNGWNPNSSGPTSPSRRTARTEKSIDGFTISPDLDFLDLAGETDGYMPGDLVLLVQRARNEALIRSVSSTSINSTIELSRKDFDAALIGFTPASLRNVTLQTSTTTFDSIGGLKTTRKVLLETLQYPTTYAPIFAQCPLRLRSGLLLYGYPGCGKTLLASAVAGECGLNFISVKGPEILNKYIGASEKSVRDLFERAEAARPCVLFFDEFDSIAPRRGHDSTGVTDRVVNMLLTMMDGAEGLSGVYVLAATSRPDLIDPALLRPGRLDKSLICDLPNLEDRADILAALSKKLHLGEEVVNNLDEIARQTEGYSGADLQALVSEAGLVAIHDLLGDNDHNEIGGKKSNGINGTGEGPRRFVQFRYGEEEQRIEAEAKARSGHNRSKEIAERAAIMAKLAEIKASRKRARHGLVGKADKGAEAKEEGEKDTEVVIRWKHVEAALGNSRASISAKERERLGGIYREFVEGRDGEMRSGEGGREVGGRVSLM